MNSRSRIATLALTTLALAIPLAACGGDAVDNGEGGRTVVLGEADSGTSAELDVGDELRIELASNATTGFSWRLAAEPAGAIALVSSEYLVPEDEGVVGAGGTEVWTFRAESQGEADLRLEYVRPFEPDNVEATFTVAVQVDS